MTEIIKTEGLSKNFGKVNAVDGVSIRVQEGEIYGFLGLNGAGKTTTIRMLLGMIKPSIGSIFLTGKKMGFKPEVWKSVGYLVESPDSYPNLTVRENLQVVFRYRQLADYSLIGEIIEKLHLSPFQNRKALELSTGNLQRLGLAKALMHKPKLLILDEPTNGLDPAGIVEVRELLKDLVSHGSTILLSSHILNEISKLATRIGIIHQGRLLNELNTPELESQFIKKFIVDTVDNNAALTYLQGKGIGVHLNVENKIVITDVAAIKNPENIATVLVNAGLPPRELSAHTEDLESYFLRAIKEPGK